MFRVCGPPPVYVQAAAEVVTASYLKDRRIVLLKRWCLKHQDATWCPFQATEWVEEEEGGTVAQFRATAVPLFRGGTSKDGINGAADAVALVTHMGGDAAVWQAVSVMFLLVVRYFSLCVL